MRPLLFISFVVLYVIVFISKHSGFYFPELINAYLSDILCLPIVLSIARYGVAYWINNAHFSLNIAHISAATLCTIFVFEVVLPFKSDLYTADLLDAAMYILGAIIFYSVQTSIVRPPGAWFQSS